MKEPNNITTTTDYRVTDLSPELFWDCRQEKHEWKDHAMFIIKRVLDYGQERDWLIIKAVYGLDTIANIAIQIPDLTEISANYLATVTDTPLSKFECYRRGQLIPHFSGY
jgi:hypothetical protein